MGLPNIDIVSGVTSFEICVTGYLCGLVLLLVYAKRAPDRQVKIQMALMGIVFIAMWHPWFGVATGFFLVSAGQAALGNPTHVLVYAWAPAVAIPIWVGLTAKSIKGGRYTNPITAVITILGGIFALLVYVDPSNNIFYTSTVGGLPDSGFIGGALALLGLMLLIVVFFVGITNLRLGLKGDKTLKWKRVSAGLGAMMFGLFTLIDAGVENIDIVTLSIVRAFIFTSAALVFQGVMAPEKKRPAEATTTTGTPGLTKYGSIQGRIIKAMVGCVLIPLGILTVICLSQLTPFGVSLGVDVAGSMIAVFLVVVGSLIIVSFFVMIRVSRRIVNPIKELTQTIDGMTKGDLSQEVSLDAMQRGGELGVLAQAFQNLLITMRLGNQSYYQGDMTLAFSNYNAALELFQTTSNQKGQGMCLNNLGNIYRNWGNFDKAMECYEQSIIIGEKQEDLAGLSSRYNNRGLLYLSRENFDLARQDFARALQIDDKIDDAKGKATRKRNFGLMHIMEKKGDLAKKILEEALQIDKGLDNTEGIVEDQFAFGRLYLLTNELDAADEMLKSALKSAENLGNYPLMRNVLKEMTRLYENQGSVSLLHKAQAELAKVEKSLISEKDVVFVIDQSGSMREQEKIVAARNGALQVFNDAINEDDNVAVIGFHSIINKILDLVPKKGHEKQIRATLECLQETQYQTCFYDAVALAIDIVKGTPKERQKWVVALTDGQDNTSKEYNSRKLAKYIRNLDQTMNIILIGVGPELKNVFKEMNEISSASPQGKYIKIYSTQNVKKQIEAAFVNVKEIMASAEIEGFTPEEK